jgi:molybdopterin biosynthesis enzyme MoaB
MKILLLSPHADNEYDNTGDTLQSYLKITMFNIFVFKISTSQRKNRQTCLYNEE